MTVLNKIIKDFEYQLKIENDLKEEVRALVIEMCIQVVQAHLPLEERQIRDTWDACNSWHEEISDETPDLETYISNLKNS